MQQPAEMNFEWISSLMSCDIPSAWSVHMYLQWNTMKSWERANTLRHRESSKNPCQSCQPRQLFLWQTSFPSDALEQLNKPLASVSASPAATLRTRVEQVEQVKPWITSNHISKKFRDMFSGEAPQSDSKQGRHSPQRQLHVDHVCSCKAEIHCSKGKCATGAD